MKEADQFIRECTDLSVDRGGNHYRWGANCDGWNLVDEKTLSVKRERMPPQTAEKRHYHLAAQQFFYILRGEAIFDIGRQELTIRAGQGIFIDAGKEHRIRNASGETLEFILTSQPSTRNDRMETE